MTGFCIGAAVLLKALDGAARAVYLLNSINKDLTKLRKEAEKYQAQNAHGRKVQSEQQRLRV